MMWQFIYALLFLTLFIGCNKEGDSINHVDSKNVIHAINGTAGTINLSISGQRSVGIVSYNQTPISYELEGKSAYEVSYDDGRSVRIEADEIYLYSATTCNHQGFLLDKVDNNRVHIVNLTSSPFMQDIIFTDINSTTQTLSLEVAPCSIASTYKLNDLRAINGMQYQIGNNEAQVVQNISTELEPYANTLSLDIVIYSDTEQTLIPMGDLSSML